MIIYQEQILLPQDLRKVDSPSHVIEVEKVCLTKENEA